MPDYPLSPENIQQAATTLAALDDLQGANYRDEHEAAVRKRNPHSESQAVLLAHQTIRRFTLRAPGGNAQGVRMHTSAFANGLRLMGLAQEADTVIKTCEQIPHE
jgi:hypothetical protein